MPNLDFVLMAHQDWDVQSVHTGLIVGSVRWNSRWNAFSFQANPYDLDSTALREIAKFLDEQDQLKRQR